MQYARELWQEERSAWRAVIQLNLLRSINTILDMLVGEFDSSRTDKHAATLDRSLFSSSPQSPKKEPPPLRWTEKHRLLSMRLAPLRGVQQDLEQRLGAAADEPLASTYAPHEALPLPLSGFTQRPQEFYVRSHDGWRSALQRFKPWQGGEGTASVVDTRAVEWQRTKDAEITQVIAGCADDMQAMWEDTVIRGMLRRKRIRMEDLPGL